MRASPVVNQRVRSCSPSFSTRFTTSSFGPPFLASLDRAESYDTRRTWFVSLPAAGAEIPQQLEEFADREGTCYPCAMVRMQGDARRTPPEREALAARGAVIEPALHVRA